MPNHFHLCIKQLVDNGISLWMHRACNSHARYFNIKNERHGALFMGRFRYTPVMEDRQLFHLFVYIHANPLDLIMSEWRDGSISHWQKSKSFLENYRWSSYGLFTKNSVIDEINSLVSTDFPASILKSWGGLEDGIRNWSQRDYNESKNIFLE